MIQLFRGEELMRLPGCWELNLTVARILALG